MTIKKDSLVKIEYTLKDDQGNIIDQTNNEDGPLEYIHGNENLIEGLEKELEGKKAGDEISVVVQPEEAYGSRDDQLVDEVPKGNFPQPDELEVGGQVVAETDEGPILFTVLEITDEYVKLDANHPLADQVLHFEVKILEVRDATKEEIEAGQH